MRRNTFVVAGLAGAVILGGGAYFAMSASQGGSKVVIPQLTETGVRGQAAFGKFCATCHGVDAGGTGSGPPLIHKLYHPGHHGDMAIVMAAKRGAHSHHWNFGNMPPVVGINEAELADIIAFIREVQFANGIY